ncbi:MAG: TetR family transcriptional regulator [Kineosporiaceae bacterium]|nr:TetR family transcriptional regulator [Kineosporiaceae bacterium]
MARSKGEQTRLLLLESARDLVAERGLSALTHRAIEGRAGVSHGVTTYHFATREALLGALLEFVGDELLAWQSAIRARLAAADPATLDHHQIAREVVTELMSRRTNTLARYELYLYAARRPDLAEVMARARRRHVDLETRAFERLGAVNPELAANRYLSALEGLVLYQISVPEPDFERWAPAYLMTVVRALLDFTGA